MIQLGQRYTDTPTGFNGIATSRMESIGGAERAYLSRLSTEGTLSEEWFDAARLAQDCKVAAVKEAA